MFVDIFDKKTNDIKKSLENLDILGIGYKDSLKEGFDPHIREIRELEEVIYGDVDMHFHSNFSDGMKDIDMLIARLKDLGIAFASLTDHDGINGVAEFIDRINGEITAFSGVEFSVVDYGDVEFHILGYEIDIKHPEIIKFCKRAMRNRGFKMEFRINCLLKKYPSLKEEFEILMKQNYAGKPHIANILVKHGIVDDVKTAFAEILDKIYIDDERIIEATPKEVIEAIKMAGGVAVMAHPVITKRIGERGSKEFWENLIKRIEVFKSKGLDGIEVFHSKHKDEEKLVLLNKALDMNLIVTRGSDYHG